MKTHQLTLSENRRGVGISLGPSVGAPIIPPTGYKTVNGKIYKWNGHSWVQVNASSNPLQTAFQQSKSTMAPLPPWWRFFHMQGAVESGTIMGLPGNVEGSTQTIGATNPSFTVPSGLDATTAGQGLLDALNNLLTTFNGTAPSEHSYSAVTAAFQTAWNADPSVSAVGGNALLQVDGGYGPNVHTAVAAINGGSAPDVNTSGASPSPSPSTPSTTIVPSTSNSIVNYWNSLPTWEQWAIGLAGLGGAVVVGNALWKKHGGMVKGKVRGHVGRAHAALRHHAARLHARLRRRSHA